MCSQHPLPTVTINREIKALLQLIEDPDMEVYATVSQQIKSFGMPIIPSLEHMWEVETNLQSQSRIETLIRELRFDDLKKRLGLWKEECHDLVAGALLAANYFHPEITIESVTKEFEKYRRSIWLELNNYLTPIEKITVVNSLLYNYFKFQSQTIDSSNIDGFIFSKILQSKTGNPYGLRMLYLILCQQLDIDVKAVEIPDQVLMGYFHPSELDADAQQLLFYIDPSNGQLYSIKDVEHYLKKITQPATSDYKQPLSNRQVVADLLTAMSKCFEEGETNHFQKELLSLADLIAEPK